LLTHKKTRHNSQQNIKQIIKKLRNCAKKIKVYWIESKLQLLQPKMTRCWTKVSGKDIWHLSGWHNAKYTCRTTGYLKMYSNCPEPVITHGFSTDYVIQLDTDCAVIAYKSKLVRVS